MSPVITYTTKGYKVAFGRRARKGFIQTNAAEKNIMVTSAGLRALCHYHYLGDCSKRTGFVGNIKLRLQMNPGVELPS